jgi:hypothetical protein
MLRSQYLRFALVAVATLTSLVTLLVVPGRLFIDERYALAVNCAGPAVGLLWFGWLCSAMNRHTPRRLFGSDKGTDHYFSALALTLLLSFLPVSRLLPAGLIWFTGDASQEQARVIKVFSALGSKGSRHYVMQLDILAPYSRREVTISEDESGRVNAGDCVAVRGVRTSYGLFLVSYDLPAVPIGIDAPAPVCKG